MKKIIALLLALVLCLSLAACGGTSAPAPAPTETPQPIPAATEVKLSMSDIIDPILQGEWTFHDANTGFNEIFIFENGSFRYKTYLDGVPTSGTETGGTYRVEDGYIASVFENGYENTLDYSFSGATLILSKYIDSGVDAGTTRIYTKRDGTAASAAPATPAPAASASTSSGGVVGIVTADNLNVRSAPNSGSDILKRLAINTRVEILEQRNVDGIKWGRIADGWINLNYVTIEEGSAASTAKESGNGAGSIGASAADFGVSKSSSSSTGTSKSSSSTGTSKSSSSIGTSKSSSTSTSKSSSSSSSKSSSSGSSKSSSSGSSKSFTNKYGTSTTRCAHSGCSNYIASSGDTNCCTTHSRRCGNCNCYIDEDAIYCMTCLTNALKK